MRTPRLQLRLEWRPESWAFAGLGVLEAHSGAWHDNAASLAVSRRLGYRDNGVELRLRRGVPNRHIKLRLTRDDWERHRRDDIEIVGLDACRGMFGADAL